MEDQKDLIKKLEGLDEPALRKKLEAVEADIKNLEDELDQRERLLHYVDKLIKKKKRNGTS